MNIIWLEVEQFPLWSPLMMFWLVLVKRRKSSHPLPWPIRSNNKRVRMKLPGWSTDTRDDYTLVSGRQAAPPWDGSIKLYHSSRVLARVKEGDPVDVQANRYQSNCLCQWRSHPINLRAAGFHLVPMISFCRQQEHPLQELTFNEIAWRLRLEFAKPNQ